MSLSRQLLVSLITGDWTFRFVYRHRSWTFDDFSAYITRAILNQTIIHALVASLTFASSRPLSVEVTNKTPDNRSRSTSVEHNIGPRTSTRISRAIVSPKSRDIGPAPAQKKTASKPKRSQSPEHDRSLTHTPSKADHEPAGMPPNDVIAIIVVVIFAIVVMIGLVVYWLTVLTRPKKVIVAKEEA